MTNMPDLTNLLSLLAKWKYKSAYIVPMTDDKGKILGNNGDELMGKIFHMILVEANISISSSIEDSDLIIVPPSGALLEVYSFPRLLREKITNYKSKPVVIMPSSAYFPTIDPSFIFAGRTAPILWILREKTSYEHLKSAWGDSLSNSQVELALDHDVVASGNKYVHGIITQTRNYSPLIVARLDRESKSLDTEANFHESSSAISITQKMLAKALPYGTVYTKLARFARRKMNQEAGSKLVQLVQDITKDIPSSGRPHFIDISDPKYATFEEYTKAIGESTYVVTNRLHVGLPAAIVGKKVFLIEAGYHKITGIYNQSLADMPNVTLLNLNQTITNN